MIQKDFLIYSGILIFCFFVFPVWGIQAQTELYPGDITLVTINADGQKNFDFLTLVDIEAGTVIYFTDDAWIGGETNGFRGSEGILCYTSDDNINAGTIISCPGKDGGNGFIESGSFNPSASGDNIIVYQGSAQNPVFIFGAGWARGSSVWEYSTISSSYRSDIPPGLTMNNFTIFSLGTKDNYQYDVSNGIIGNPVEILQLVSNPSNSASGNTVAFNALVSQFQINDPITIGSGSDVNWINAQWSNGLPDETKDVIIDGNILVNNDMYARDLKILSGSGIEVMSGSSLVINRNITNLQGVEGLIINSGSGAYANLVCNNSNIEGRYNLFVEKDQWHFVTSPVINELSVNDIFGDTQSDLFGIYQYDEPNAEWLSALGSDIISCLGYNIYYENESKSISFSGEFGSFPVTNYIPLSKTGNNGWNLIGNPFPCTIDWGNIQDNDAVGWLNQNQLVENKTIYITTGGSGSNTSFSVYNGNSGIGIPDNESRYIAPGQGFWVRATETGELGINNLVRSSIQSEFKSDSSSNLIIRMNITNDKYSDQAVLCEIYGAENKYEIFDSEKILNPNSLKIYSVQDDKNLAINALPFTAENTIIDIGYNSYNEGNLRFDILPENVNFHEYDIILEDLYENIKTEINETGNYEFYSLVGEFNDRFVIFIKKKELSIPEHIPGTKDIEIVQMGKSIAIKCSKAFDNGEILVSNILGQVMLFEKMNNMNEKVYNINYFS